MVSKFLSTAVLAASVAFTPATRVAADAGDFVAGALIGGLIGHAATKEAQRKKAAQRTYRPGIPSTQEGREIQSSLNYFGFNAGRVDGQLGRNSREAISRYQIYMGYPATGQLTPIEHEILTTSYQRAQLNVPSINQAMMTHPDGPRGLLKTYRQELAGGATVMAQQPAQTTVVVTPQVVAPQPGTTLAVAPTAPAVPNFGTAAAATTVAALPNFAAQPVPTSLAAHCNAIGLVTNTNGGYIKVDTMTDPGQALNEQFCLARTYAIEDSERLAAQVPGMTPQQVADQCAAFGPAMQPYVTTLGTAPQPAVLQAVAGFIPTTGMTPAQIQTTARICMGVGYRTDNMGVALGSALLMAASGQPVYSELVGHHLMNGFGVAPRADLAGAWFNQSFDALAAGQPAVFNPGDPARTMLLKQAVAQAGGAAPVQPASATGLTVPTFTVKP